MSKQVSQSSPLLDKVKSYKENDPNNPDIPWKKHLFYKIYFNVRRLFCSPNKSLRAKDELDLVDHVNLLLQGGDSSDPETINKCAQFLNLNRHLENTAARKRLEKWAKRVISTYLLVVLLIVVFQACSISNPNFEWLVVFQLDKTVLITLLTTTTVNIIGLGLIVLRGHFPSDDKKIKDDSLNTKPDESNPAK